jgi:restriction system protein
VAIPDFQTIIRPVLALLADDQEHTVTEIRERLAEDFSLSQEELEAMLPSGRAKMFANRVGLATTYLYQTKMLERPKRSVYRITPRGHEILAQNPSRVNLKVLSQFEELREFRAKSPTGIVISSPCDAGSVHLSRRLAARLVAA